jgi:toxin-antitoxin system PIN domain toxin
MAPALLDVNVLVALFDPDHVHHEAAHGWFAEQRPNGWATCPITENGLIRVLTHPGYAAAGGGASEIVGRLRAFCGSGHHRFWGDEVSLRDARLFRLRAVLSRQLTDVYLLGLATHKGGCLATFDRGIPRDSVVGATGDHLVIIGS